MKKVFILVLSISIIAIGAFLLIAPTQVDKSLNKVLEHTPYTVSSQAQQLHSTLIVGDWHADTLLWNRDISAENNYGHVDLPRLRSGNVALQMFTTVTKSPEGLNYNENSGDSADSITKLAMVQRWPADTWNNLTARALHQSFKLLALAQDRPDELMVIRSQLDLQLFLQKRENNERLIGGLIGTEGSHALEGKLENVQVLYDAGFRMMSLQHFFDNKLGASLHGKSQSGLTEFGREVVQEINALNIMLDVSHSSEQTVEETLELSNKPLIVSHTGFKGHCNTARNISDELMQRIAAKGGLIAVGFWDAAVCGEHPSQIVAAIQYGIELVGEDHVALGSDFDGSISTSFDTSELAALTHYMLEANFSETQIRKVMGGNMLKFLQTHLPVN